jgi:hypothetical protein
LAGVHRVGQRGVVAARRPRRRAQGCATVTGACAGTPGGGRHTVSRHAGSLAGRYQAVNDDRMDATRARALAERLHRDDREPDGTPRLAHIRRVVRSVPPDARPVAWLHEALEAGVASEHELLRDGLESDELRALRLLNRSRASETDSAYLAHLQLIGYAAGRSGRLARAVKIADLTDRTRHPLLRRDGWIPPYRTALELLLHDAGDRTAAGAF